MQTVTEKLEGMDVWIYHGQIYIPNTYSAGAVGSRFLIELRDKKRIMGTRCPACNRVYVPARSICKDCFGQLDEWVEVSDRGTVLTYAVDHESKPIQPMATPIVYGIIQLDGADTGFVHMLGEVDPEQLRVGMKVQAVFKEERVGNILDIKYFKPLA
ncbi:MAG: Zn-ribbon domain-containing OB-fold protein [Dehalococcoidia bacterium]|nr:MAG: Zn-ribbon domain-containing OB-fold protein [Dehalococcoidia bacterium]